MLVGAFFRGSQSRCKSFRDVELEEDGVRIALTIVDHPNGHDDDSQSPTAPSPKQESPTASKPDGLQQPAKPQATFLTKLYASVTLLCLRTAPSSDILSNSLLERPENQHMIRWDPAGEHIIVERPEQLALHVLPSVYRQSRFASFSRQLNVSHRQLA